MGGQRVLVGPGRGHRFEVRSLPLLHRIRNRGSVALGRYEPRVTAFLSKRLPFCGVFADVGACTGYYTRIALNLMPGGGRVVAFEPDADAAVSLRLTFGDSRLTVRAEALGRDDHQAILDRRAGVASRVRGESITASGFLDSASVNVRSLDGMVEAGELPPPELLKVDVEGGEVLVLEGMSAVLERRPALVVECHSMPLLSQVLDLLIDHGYDHLEVTGGGDDVGPPTVLAATAD
jgi:FkbM family methyltransferase